MSLVTVRVETLEGSIYNFPDMDGEVIDRLLCERAISDFHKIGQLSFVNISKSVLMIPFRIVACIYVDGVERWRSPVSTAEGT